MILAFAVATSACGGAASAKPSGGFGPNDARARYAPAEAPEKDSDGILDKTDAEPREPMSEVAAKAPPPPAPPPPPGQAGQAGQPGPAPKPEPASTEQAKEVQRDTSMIIYTARVTMAVYQVDQGITAVERIARESGGYLSVKKDREITIRVPRARFEAALAQVDKIGDVIHRDVEALDVTDEYVDVEIRIKNARSMRARLEELLKRAPVKEALEIEKELHRVTQDLELLEGKLKLLKDKIAYSTITVSFEPRTTAIATTKVRLPFPWLTQLGLPNLLNLSEYK